ncbi:MAG TPA: fumarate reductase/succinate dehydrogenase flavoprotein subunit [Planctomycetota bacterium]|nr:fumarate reductase/succinate dehydrogenase flavoprotein subunit [Planctomycetota bacterium]MDP7245245.1 fumarate reductase/succinate dehydrogenase flavoprotein subunit [Planctomycetota bacterium]HJM39536.1 fumarate reductase/succinate dehydrogenase flavoprotein subunit [Planctomycetota bacterium]
MNLSSDIQRIRHDVVVIGAGGAGLRAAIASSSRGLDTGVVCKSLLGKAHTVMAEGGCAAALGNADSRDNWKVHFRDTMRGGKFLNQWEMAELHAKHAPDEVKLLEQWGAVFDRTPEGLIGQRNFGGHRYPRLAHVGDRTGLEMIRTLQDHAIHQQGIQVHMECTALRIVMDGDKLAGVLAYWRDAGRFVLFECNAVILATGGGGKAWRITSNSWEYTGDGFDLAYKAGAELVNMEFTQFHPTGMVWPPSVRGILVTEGVRGDGGILLNSEGERFMFNYIPEKFAAETADSEEEAERWLAGDKNARRPPELLTRDVVARAITKEVQAGRGSPHGGVFLDIASRRPADVIRRKLPSMYHQFKELAEVDITKDAMEVGPTLHYFMGGIRVDSNTQMTRVPGLFACGECSGGMHGANRLGGNSLSDLLVFGMLAGNGAADYLDKLEATPQASSETVDAAIREATAPLNREEGPNPYLLHEELQDVMNNGVNIVRDKEGLESAIQSLDSLKQKASAVKAHGSSQYNPGWHEAISLSPLLITAESVARAALAREESRGAHTRIDFPGEQDRWQAVHVIISKSADGSMNVRQESAQAPPERLSEIAHSSLTDLEGGSA